MAYNECQAERFRKALTGKSEFAEKRMMGGLIFLLNGNMIGGIDIDPSGASCLEWDRKEWLRPYPGQVLSR